MMPAPCFSQEFAPTSVALAETQSMFLDSLLGDPDWLVRYAKNEAGESMPVGLIRQVLRQSHEYRAHGLRKMLAVSYAEKGIYELSESELTPERVLEIIRDVEQRMLYQEGSGRPILSIPHLLAGESSAYYHGYVLAQIAVFQTRDFFLKRDGHIADNPNVGRDLTQGYWRPGNSVSFLDLVQRLTGEPFSPRATVELVNKSLDDVYRDADDSIARERELPRRSGPVELGCEITVIHGDETIATTNGGDFARMSEGFASWIREQEELARETSDRSMAG
jgi:oligoendopeptidase F